MPTCSYVDKAHAKAGTALKVEVSWHCTEEEKDTSHAMRTACANAHSTQWAAGQRAGAAWWPGSGQPHTPAATEQLFTALAPSLLALLANDPGCHIASCLLAHAIHRRCAASRTMPPSLRCPSCPPTTTSRRAAVWQPPAGAAAKRPESHCGTHSSTQLASFIPRQPVACCGLLSQPQVC